MAIGAPVLIGTNNSLTNSTSIAITVPVGGVPAGATIWVLWQGGEAGSSFGCTDTAGNTYTADLSDAAHAVGNAETHFFRASNVSALVSTNTIIVSWTTNVASKSIIAAYATGVAATTPGTGTPVIAEGTSTAPDSGNTTTTDAAAILIGLVGWQDAGVTTLTEDSDFTAIGTTNETLTNNIVHLAYRIVSATETNKYAPAIDVSSSWHCGVAAYKAASAVGSGLTSGVLREKRRLVA